MAEPETRFHKALLEDVPPEAGAGDDVWLSYALSTNERGAQVVAKVQEFTPDLRGLRLLDIGSGYGGVCIAAARAGAAAVGIEVDPSLRRLAELNLADFPALPVRFSDADAMDWTRLSALGRFDVITCDNVIEHVSRPPVLLAHARRLLEPDGLLYLTVPNAFSFGQITKECHYGQFGLSLLDADDGERWLRELCLQPSYDVSVYLRLAEYESLLARYGLHAKMLNPVGTADEEVDRVRAARREVEQARVAATVPASLRSKLDRFLDRQLACCDADLAFFDALAGGHERELFGQALGQTYFTELWYFVASPDAGRFDAWPAATARERGLTFGDVLRVARGVGARAKELAGRAITRTQNVGPAP